MNNNSGFTLIEFLVAIVILMVGLLGMLQGINIAMDKSLENVFRNEAVQVADDFMMAKRSKAFVSISATTANPAWQYWPLDPNDNAKNAGKPQTQRIVRGGIYKNYSVQQIVTDKTPYSKELVINVSWKYKSRKSSHSISSLVSTTSL